MSIKILLSRQNIVAASVLFALCVALLPSPAHALRVSLKRLIFEGKSRSQVVTVINNGAEDETYRLGWRNFRMTEDKVLVLVPEGEEGDLKLAEPLLRYAPRRFTVKAGESQQIRIVSRYPRDLEDGEYRSHLYIVPEEKPLEFSAQEMKDAKTKQVIKIGLLTGLSLPVFVRKGDLKVNASLSDMTARKDGEKLIVDFVINRDGDRSLFGDIDFVCVSGGTDKVVSQNLGVAVYPEVDKRPLHYTLPYPKEGCSELRVSYISEVGDTQYSGKVIASSVVNIAQ